MQLLKQLYEIYSPSKREKRMRKFIRWWILNHVKGATVTMTQAFHSSESASPCGYIVEMPDGLTVYHAGDTCVFGDMALWGKLFRIDVALLPTGGHYTMDGRQAAMACGLLKCAAAVPMHWGTFPVLAQSDEPFAKALAELAPKCRHLHMKPGETADFAL